MSFDGVISSMRGRQDLSTQQKRQILWNIIQPGDPYDITKSMIAKLPGDQRSFMGQHIELVCLMQAAEIQRLCQFLEQYKLKYRETERKELDRHSYEVQIKELTQKVTQKSEHENENRKLRDFLKKQTIELEELHQRSITNKDLAEKYEEALRKIETLMQENLTLNSRQKTLSEQNKQLIARITATESAKERQIYELTLKLNNESNKTFERQRQSFSAKLQAEELKFQLQLKRQRQINESKNRQIEQLQSINKKLQENLEDQIKNRSRFQYLERAMTEYQNRFGLLTEEIERLNNVLRNKSNQSHQLNNKIAILESQVKQKVEENGGAIDRARKLQIQIVQYVAQINEQEKKIRYLAQNEESMRKYQGRIQQLVEEMERLNLILSKKLEEIDQYKQRISHLELESSKVGVVMRENQQLRRIANQAQELRRKIVEYQNRLAGLSQQILRANSLIGSLQQEKKHLKHDNEELRSRLVRLEGDIAKITEYEARITMMIQQIQRLNNSLRIKLQQCGNWEKRFIIITNEKQSLIRALQQTQQKHIAEWQQKANHYESRINQLSTENHSLQNKIHELQQTQSKLSQYEQHIEQLGRQLARVNKNLRVKVAENEEMRRTASSRSKESEQKISQLLLDVERLSNAIMKKSEEIEELRRKVSSLDGIDRKVSEYENTIALLSQEIERLNERLSAINEDNDLLRKSKDQLKEKYEEQIKSRSWEMQSHKQKLTQYEGRLEELAYELQRLNDNLKIKVDQSSDLEAQNARLQAKVEELKSRIREEKQKEQILQNLRAENQRVNNLNQAMEDKLELLIHQLERIQEILKQKVEENVLLVEKNQSLQSEIRVRQSTLIQQWQIKISRIVAEWETKLQNCESQLRQAEGDKKRLQQKIQSIEEYEQKTSEYEGKIIQFNQQLERLNHVIREKLNQIQRLTDQIKTVQAQNQALRKRSQDYDHINRKLSEYENRIAHLNQQNQKMTERIAHSHTLQQQLISLRKINSELESRTSQLSQDYRTKISTLQTKLVQLNNEKEDLWKKLQETNDLTRKLGQYENRAMLMTQEIERLNTVLRGKVNSEQTIKELRKQVEMLKRSNSEFNLRITTINQEWQSKLATSQSRIKQFALQNEDLKKKSHEQNDAWRREVETYKKQLNDLSESRRGKTADFQNKVALLAQENERLNLALRAKSEELNKCLPDIERLNNTLRLKLEESKRYESSHAEMVMKIKSLEEVNGKVSTDFNAIRLSYELLIEQHQKLKKHTVDYDLSIKKLYGEFERLQQIMQELKRQNSNLKIELRQSQGLIDKNRVLCAEIDRQNEIIQGLKGQIGQLRLRITDDSSLQRRIQQHMALMVILFAEIQSLRKRVKETEKEVEDVRRSSLAPFKV